MSTLLDKGTIIIAAVRVSLCPLQYKQQQQQQPDNSPAVMRVTQPVKCKSAVLPGAQWHHQATLQITAMEALQAFNNWVPPQLHNNRTSVTQQPGTHAGNQTTQSEQPIYVAGSSLQVSNIQAGRSIGALTTNQATCAADSSSPQATTPHAAHYLQEFRNHCHGTDKQQHTSRTPEQSRQLHPSLLWTACHTVAPGTRDAATLVFPAADPHSTMLITVVVGVCFEHVALFVLLPGLQLGVTPGDALGAVPLPAFRLSQLSRCVLWLRCCGLACNHQHQQQACSDHLSSKGTGRVHAKQTGWLRSMLTVPAERAQPIQAWVMTLN